MGDDLNQKQLDLIKLLWGLAQTAIDALYSEDGAEEEKQAVEMQIKRALSYNDASELVRWNSPLAEE